MYAADTPATHPTISQEELEYLRQNIPQKPKEVWNYNNDELFSSNVAFSL
jgi:hypothetical protein